MSRYNTRTCLAAFLLVCLVSRRARSDEWPAYQHDLRRTGYSSEKIDVSQLQLAWSWHSPSPPQPAWAGPAKWDAYAGHRDLPPMRSYDLSFQPIAIGGDVFFGSSADDSMYCVDAASGGQRWSYVTEGPIRTAPTYADGRLFFGSDDGFAYCLDAKDGTLVWKYRPVETERLILNNGRFIPFHPCRTGVLVDRGRAYFGCALLPWKDGYLCSVDVETGQPEGEGCYVQKLPGATLEGPPAATSELLVFPQGRVAPRIFNRNDGVDQGLLKKSSGGSIVVVSLDASLFHGPGADSRKGGINRSNLKTREVIAGHGRGNALVVAGGMSYMLTDDSLIASDLIKRENKWIVPCDQTYSLIGVGDTLFAGGRDEVVAYRAADGTPIWRTTVEGKAYGLAAANGRLFVSTDAGVVHAFVPGTSAKPIAEETAVGDEFKPLAVEQVTDQHLRGRWVFQQPHVEAKKVQDLAATIHGTIDGTVRLKRAGRFQALSLDGRSHSVLLAADHTEATLPTKEITVEAWLRVDQAQKWGGIIGAVQDNGSYERGWILGFRDARFSFALAGKGGSGALTYLTAKRDFEQDYWYHVAGTYDGATMRLYVDGKLENESVEQKGEINYPPKAFFEIGAYHDDDENYRLKGQIHEVRLYDKTLDATELAAHAASKASLLPSEPEPQDVLEVAVGPWLKFTDPESAIVRWRTEDPTPTVLEYWLDGERTTIKDEAMSEEHGVRITGLLRNRVYRYVIRETRSDVDLSTREFECDTFFSFTAPDVDAGEAGPFAESTRSIIKTANVDRGIGLVLGSERGQLALELARQTRLRVIAVETDAGKVHASREFVRAAGVYGSRVTVRKVEDLSKLPFVGNFANLVVSEVPITTDQRAGVATEIFRVLRPDGGVACLGSTGASKELLRTWSEKAGFEVQLEQDEAGSWAVITRGPLPGASGWSHQYGRADNSAFGGEQLVGVESSDDLDVQWIGRPGPRFKPDRNGRKPSPLSTAGRLFVQGLNRIAALDAYNGTVLWSLEIPDLQRFNMPRDCSNWCADRDFVYAAVRNKCWQIDAASGKVVKIHDVVTGDGEKFDWGSLVSMDYQLIGTSVKEGTSWTNFWGGADAGWYDARSGAVTDKVCADNLFSIDKNTGQTKWKYSKGVVINSTVTVHDDRIYFVECRNREVIDGEERRIGNPKLWEDQYLVALDAYTGKLVWERPIDTEDGKVVFYLAGGTAERLVIVASADEKYHVYGFSTDGGEQLWNQTFRWPGGKGDHGKAMSRPAIVGDRVYVRPHAFQLADGKQLPQQMPGGGCGTYACSAGALFFRASTVTMWNQDTGKATGWSRLRPDCWLSAIPAAGMLLSAEGGGGCSCGTWMETSVGFMPVSVR
ncbi:MAG: PQQ-binding-like beta-propeller repeat protein [Planctomycetes bacterium]|nr:PQQ-binding-like beta-propeller repeat protein [Planctomycetota bacterium]